MTWGQTTKWYYVPYRSLKPYRVMGVELKVHEKQSVDHDELGCVTFPLKASVVLDSDMLAFLTSHVKYIHRLITHEVCLTAKTHDVFSIIADSGLGCPAWLTLISWRNEGFYTFGGESVS